MGLPIPPYLFISGSIVLNGTVKTVPYRVDFTSFVERRAACPQAAANVTITIAKTIKSKI